MIRFFNNALVMVAIGLVFFCQQLQASPREASRSDGAVLKLQSMVRSLTKERDDAKAETAKLTAEIDDLKKQHSQAVVDKEQLGSELSAQKNSNGEVRSRLDQTHAKLLEVIEKYKKLDQDKSELSNSFAQLKASQEATEQQLKTCDQHNVKLYQSAQELLEKYQNKGTFSAMLQDEPILQFQSVEMENIIQEYEDKLRQGQYTKNVN
jgi:chromosome segregation ATPase